MTFVWSLHLPADEYAGNYDQDNDQENKRAQN